MIRDNQIKSLQEASEHNLVAGFICNFRNENNDTFFIEICDFVKMIENINKKSFNINDLKNNNAIQTLSNNGLIITDTSSKEFEPYVTELSSINSTLKDCISGVTVNTKSASSILSDDLSKLSALKEKVASTVVANNETPEIIPKLTS